LFTQDALHYIETTVTAFKPDVVGLSVRNIDNVDMSDPVFFLDDLQSIANTIRARTCAPIILGGAALGVMTEEILRLATVSCAVIGDGEMVFPQLVDRISRGERYSDVPGVASIENGVFHLNNSAPTGFSATCPVPDYQRWLNTPAYRSQMATAPIQTKTGCQFQCVYCTYPKIEGSNCRLKDPGSIVDAVVRLAAKGLRDIEFVDSVFNAPLEHAMEVCAALARVKHTARLQCLELNPRDFDDALMTAMEWAGFVGMGITVESASDPVLQGLNKGFTSRDVHHAAEVVVRHRIPCAWIFLLGGPGETPETVRETLQFAEKYIRPTDVVFFNTGIRIYPGTELESIARKQGVLSRPPEAMLAPVFYVSPDVDAHWMGQELKKSMGKHMNFINIESLSLSFLPNINRIGSMLGLRPPLWRHTRNIRRVLRFAGMDV
jgi:radical SAM superfamily enzyme YgiQ (UPF0313 family)